MLQLPHVCSLQETVQTMIKENKRERYNPTYFTKVIANTTDLVSTCSNLISNQSSYSALTDAFWSHPELLTLEESWPLTS